MFLIVMLSFAIISEVSAVAIDEAEPGESGLNESDGSFNSSDLKYKAKDYMDYLRVL